MLGGCPIKRKRLVYRFFANQFAGYPRDRIPSLETTPIGYAVIPERAE